MRSSPDRYRGWDNDTAAAVGWWATAIGLSLGDFTKPYLKPAGTGHRTNTLPHGVCRLTMRRSSDALHRTLAWIEELPDHLGPVHRLPSSPGR